MKRTIQSICSKKENKDTFEASTDKIEGKTAKSKEGQIYEGRYRQNKSMNADTPPKKYAEHTIPWRVVHLVVLKPTHIPVCKTRLK